jgi:hypothetical protein
MLLATLKHGSCEVFKELYMPVNLNKVYAGYKFWPSWLAAGSKK